MDAKVKVIVAALIIGVLIVVGVHFLTKGPSTRNSGSNKGRQEEGMLVASVRETVERPRVEGGAVKDLKVSPQVVKTVVVTSGKAANADWGVKGTVSFALRTLIDCEVEILELKELPNAEIKVVEKRTYSTVRQQLELSEADLSLSLYETLPLDTVFGLITTLGGGIPAVSGVVAANATLKAIDGTSVRKILDKFSVSVPRDLENTLNGFLSEKIKTYIPMKPSDLEGKSYLITYYQEKEQGGRKALPLRMDVCKADGSRELTDEEWMVLRRANAFLDCSFTGNKKKHEVGDKWVVESGDFECLFDPYVEGRYKGKVTIERKPDEKNGDWNLEVHPGTVAIVSDEGRAAGEVRIENGVALLDAGTSVVKSLALTGKAAAKKLSKHHLLCTARIEGMCDYSARMSVKEK